MTVRSFMCRIVVLVFALAASVSPVHSGDVRYVYDALGRLIAVIDTAGDTATYTYDAIGNILSIGRYASSAVSIISFLPSSGPVSTSVTISGTGFSTTPSQNTVTFNGTAATVSSASTTQLVVTVPTGATTGTINVTAPGGSATSGTAFTVTTSNTPTITSFTPTVGAAGATVTISGTNFQTSALSNRLQFNLTGVAASTSTSTSITTTSPTLTSSGRIKVTTPYGQATSADDFFIPPSPYVGSDVLFTGRMGFSQSTGVALPTANKIGLVVFDGTIGQRVSVKVVPGSATSLVRLYSPSMTILGSYNGGTTGIIEPVQLPKSGTHAVMVDPIGTATGTVTITAYDVPADPTSSITLGGPAVSLSMNTPGQNGSLTFSGTAQHRVSLKMDSGGPGSTVSILNPDGSTVGSALMGGLSFFEPVVLPATATYSVFVDPTGANTGTATLTAYDVAADLTGTLTIGGGSQNVPITSPGQNGSYTFSGTASQVVTVRVTNNNMSVTVKLLKPDGSTMTSSSSGSASFNLTQQTLPTTGTYTVVVDPITTSTGSLNVAVTSP